MGRYDLMVVSLLLLFSYAWGRRSAAELLDMDFGSVEAKLLGKRLTMAECRSLTKSVHGAVVFALTHMENNTDLSDMLTYNLTDELKRESSDRLLIGHQLDEDVVVNKTKSGKFVVSCESLVDYWAAGQTNQKIMVALASPPVNRMDLVHKLRRRFGRRLKKHLDQTFKTVNEEGKRAKRELEEKYERMEKPVDIDKEQQRISPINSFHFKPNEDDIYPTWSDVLSFRDGKGNLKRTMIFWISAYTIVFALIISCHCLSLISPEYNSI